MAKQQTMYITTPIYYPNDIPHLGHAYTTLAADILARWHTLQGKDVFFLTGTDEHGKKLQEAAQKAGKQPKAFIDTIVPEFKEAWKKLNIHYDRFIRTTDADHEAVVQKILTKVHKKETSISDHMKDSIAQDVKHITLKKMHLKKNAPRINVL